MLLFDSQHYIGAREGLKGNPRKSFNVKGEFGEPCEEKFKNAVEDLKYLNQYHDPSLILQELTKEVEKV